MSGRLIITLTGMIKQFLRFFNRLLGFLLGFTGVWFWLMAYGGYKSVITYNVRLKYSAWADWEWAVCIGAAFVSVFIFLYNCYRFYSVMPDNIVTRLIRSIFEPNYRPEREGNNVPENMKMITKREKNGFFFGVKWLGLFPKKFYVAKPANEDGHILVVGGAGSGKSAAIAKNALETWKDPIVAIDIKGELSAHCKKLWKTTYLRPALFFAPADTASEVKMRYDPYYLLHHGGEENLVQNAREIALAIIPLPLNVREPFWIQGAQNLLTAAILYYFDLGASFTDTMTAIQTTSIDKLIDEIDASANTAAKMYINTARDLKLETLAGIATELSNKIMVFATDPLIRAAMCDSRTDNNNLLSWRSLDNFSIFIQIPEDKLEQWASVTTLMINQLFRTLERRADTGKDGKKARPVLILLDEAARLGKIETIKNALATLRSKAVTICLIVQSLAQLDEIYGREARRTIVDNCSYKAILSATDADSQEYLSRLVGTCEVEKESHSAHFDVDDGLETGRGSNWSKHREPIIFPHEFAKLKDVVMITPEGFCRVDKVYAPRPDEPLPKEDKPKATGNASSKTAAAPVASTTAVPPTSRSSAKQDYKAAAIITSCLTLAYFIIFFTFDIRWGRAIGLYFNIHDFVSLGMGQGFIGNNFVERMMSTILAYATIPIILLNIACFFGWLFDEDFTKEKVKTPKKTSLKTLTTVTVISSAMFFTLNFFTPFYLYFIFLGHIEGQGWLLTVIQAISILMVLATLMFDDILTKEQTSEKPKQS